MKKLLLALGLTSATMTLCAQQSFSLIPMETQSKTDALFRGPRVGTLNKRFDFMLPAGNRMILEFTQDNQVDSLPDVEALLQSVWQDLNRLDDSLNTPLANMRVDIVARTNSRTVRVQEFAQQGSSYGIKNGEVTQFKVEQDTLRLTLFTRVVPAYSRLTVNQPYYITFLLNHLTDLPSVSAQSGINATVNVFKTDFAQRRHQSTSESFTRYYALYDAITQRRVSPSKGRLNSVYRSTELIPYVHTSIQYLRGAWVPSVGAGLQFTNTLSESYEHRYQLLWEPHFVFGSDSVKRNVARRNDFITFRFHSFSHFSSINRKVEFRQSFSLGYLIRRKGDHFQPSTFKFSLPGLQTKNVLLEPEFFFNDFFKNFSPSLRLTLFLE